MPNPFELMHFIEIEGVLVGKIFSGYLREVIMYKKDNTLCKLFCTKKIHSSLFNSCIKNRVKEEPEGPAGLRSDFETKNLFRFRNTLAETKKRKSHNDSNEK